MVSSQQSTPHAETPEPPADQNRVGRGDGAGAMPRTCPDVGRSAAGGAAHHNVLHWQDHQVSEGLTLYFVGSVGFLIQSLIVMLVCSLAETLVTLVTLFSDLHHVTLSRRDTLNAESHLEKWKSNFLNELCYYYRSTLCSNTTFDHMAWSC